jgi:hypothetical protein
MIGGDAEDARRLNWEHLVSVREELNPNIKGAKDAP